MASSHSVPSTQLQATIRDDSSQDAHAHHHHHRHRRRHHREAKHSPYGPSIELTFKFHDERITPDVVVIEEQLLPGVDEGDVCEVLGKNGEVLEMFEMKFHSQEIKKKLSTASVSIVVNTSLSLNAAIS